MAESIEFFNGRPLGSPVDRLKSALLKERDDLAEIGDDFTVIFSLPIPYNRALRFRSIDLQEGAFAAASLPDDGAAGALI